MSDASFWKNKRVLVTGAGGFIGSHLAESVAALGARTRCLLRYNSQGSVGWLAQSPLRTEMEIFHGDVRDCESVARASEKVDIIFHLAALIGIPYSYESPRSYTQTNIEATLNVLEAARRHGTERVVCTSTSEVYGSAQYVPIDEKHPLRGQSPYSATKIGADTIAESYHLSFGMPVSIARPFNTYGPRQSSRAVIPTILTQVLAQEKILLGNLHSTRDFNFISDTVEGFLAIARTPEAIGRTLNIGSGTETTIQELLNTIIRLTGRSPTVEIDESRLRPEASEVDRLCADSSQMRALTGWSSTVPLEEGLARTIDWITRNLASYSIGTYAV